MSVSRPVVSLPDSLADLAAGASVDPAWVIEVDGFDPLREREVESWLTVANGYTGTRGSVEKDPDASSAATYIAGLFAHSHRDGDPQTSLFVAPDWTHLVINASGDAPRLNSGKIIEHRRLLDLRNGVLYRLWRHRLESGAILEFSSARFASLADRQHAVLLARGTIDGTPIGISGDLRAVEGNIWSVGFPTSSTEIRTAVMHPAGGDPLTLQVETATRDGELDRIVTIAGSKRNPESRDASATFDPSAVDALFARHRTSWHERWDDSDVIVEGDVDAQRSLRFALYHLISAADPTNEHVSVGARGLTGPGYSGHVFWDTDVFVLPVFIYTHPPSARALLAYRFHTLDAARAKATLLGCRGALFAWESADTGEETTPPWGTGPNGERVEILTGQLEHHISADIAWATWQYWHATGDDQFFTEMGAEMVLETARFWASRARRGRDGRFHIRGVIGPDEYHERVADNAFTNVMARWTIERGLETVNWLRSREPDTGQAASRLRVASGELSRWREVSANLHDGFDPATGLFEQFSGYFSLEDLRADEIAERPFAADVALGRQRATRSQLLKQADVLMLPFLLGDEFTPEVVAANYDYYEPRTTHGSSLSPAVHSTIAARAGHLDQALEYFRMTAAIDLNNRFGNASEGVHMAALGGLWHAAVIGFGGVRTRDGFLTIDPRLPPGWRRLAFPFRWRNATLRFDIRPKTLIISCETSTVVGVGEQPPTRVAGGRYTSQLTRSGWAPLEAVSGP